MGNACIEGTILTKKKKKNIYIGLNIDMLVDNSKPEIKCSS